LDGIDISRAEVTIGLFLGAIFPFLFAALTINAVGRAAGKMIDEVRRQFRDIPGVKEGNPDAKPDYETCVDIATRGSLPEMIVPGVLTIGTPLVVGLSDVEVLGRLLG